MRVPKEPVKLADVPEPELHCPIPDPKKLAQHLIESGRTLAEAYAAARNAVRPVKENVTLETERIELLVRQRGPDWSFTTTGNRYPVSSQLLDMVEMAAHYVQAYITALTAAEQLLDQTKGLIERADRYHADRREQASTVTDLELLELYWVEFVKMKSEHSKLYGLLTVECKKLPVDVASRCVICLARAVTTVSLMHDQAQDVATLARSRAQIVAFRAAPYPVNERIGALEVLLRPLLPKGQLHLPRKTWPAGDDLFSEPTIQ